MLNVLILGVLLLTGGQQAGTGKASGDLEVTAVVTSSVSATLNEDGRAVIVVANAPADEQTLVNHTQAKREATAVAEKSKASLIEKKQRSAVSHIGNQPLLFGN